VARRSGKAPAESRRRIIDSARVVFRDGFMEANLDEVASRAGVAKGTLYRYFDSKAELYVAVLADHGEIFERRMRETVDTPGCAPPDLIRRLGRFYFAHWMRNPDYFQIFWAIENQNVIGELPAGMIAEVTRLWEKCVAMLAEIVERASRRGISHRAMWESRHPRTVANGLIRPDAARRGCAGACRGHLQRRGRPGAAGPGARGGG
jgi:AcrR family transcriptional regulator